MIFVSAKAKSRKCFVFFAEFISRCFWKMCLLSYRRMCCFIRSDFGDVFVSSRNSSRDDFEMFVFVFHVRPYRKMCLFHLEMCFPVLGARRCVCFHLHPDHICCQLLAVGYVCVPPAIGLGWSWDVVFFISRWFWDVCLMMLGFEMKKKHPKNNCYYLSMLRYVFENHIQIRLRQNKKQVFSDRRWSIHLQGKAFISKNISWGDGAAPGGGPRARSPGGGRGSRVPQVWGRFARPKTPPPRNAAALYVLATPGSVDGR